MRGYTNGIKPPNISFNLLEAEKLIAEAVKAGAKLVALPENFALMGDHESDKLKAKEADGTGPIQNFLATVAKKVCSLGSRRHYPYGGR